MTRASIEHYQSVRMRETRLDSQCTRFAHHTTDDA